MLAALPLTALLLAQATTASPSPTPSSACFHDARVVKPAIPRDFEPGDLELAATISVTVASDGLVKSATVAKSSGDLEFDMASVRAAKKALYSAKVVDCKPVESTVPFRATFTPGWAVHDTPSPSSTASTCPTTEVVRITANGPIPSATPFKQKGPPYAAYATVLVTVNSDGSVKNAVIDHGSLGGINDEALREARSAVYRPKMVNCRAVEGKYIYVYLGLVV